MVLEAALAVFTPREPVRTFDWARDHATDEHGHPYDDHSYPHLGAPGGPFDALDCRQYLETWLQWATRLGKSFVGEVGMMKTADRDPCPMLLVAAVKGLALEIAGRTTRMIEHCDRLASQLPTRRNKQVIELAYCRQFIGWPRSSATLADKEIGFGHGAEVDKWEHLKTSTEAEPLALFLERFKNKVAYNALLEGSPGLKHASKIERGRLAGTNAHLWVECQRCGRYQVLRKEQLHFEQKPAAPIASWPSPRRATNASTAKAKRRRGPRPDDALGRVGARRLRRQRQKGRTQRPPALANQAAAVARLREGRRLVDRSTVSRRQRLQLAAVEPLCPLDQLGPHSPRRWSSPKSTPTRSATSSTPGWQTPMNAAAVRKPGKARRAADGAFRRAAAASCPPAIGCSRAASISRRRALCHQRRGLGLRPHEPHRRLFRVRRRGRTARRARRRPIEPADGKPIKIALSLLDSGFPAEGRLCAGRSGQEARIALIPCRGSTHSLGPGVMYRKKRLGKDTARPGAPYVLVDTGNTQDWIDRQLHETPPGSLGGTSLFRAELGRASGLPRAAPQRRRRSTSVASRRRQRPVGLSRRETLRGVAMLLRTRGKEIKQQPEPATAEAKPRPKPKPRPPRTGPLRRPGGWLNMP
jgi:hypothetical protein